MRYLVIGAGAIGGAVGARLRESGHDVAFVARGQHGDAIREHGLALATPDSTVHVTVPVHASVAEFQFSADDAVLLAVKSQDAPAILDELSAVAGHETRVFCLQNGLHTERVAARHFEHVHGVCVFQPGSYTVPGRVEANSAPLTGLMITGRFPRGEDDYDARFAADLLGSTYAARTSDDVRAWKRRKLLVNLGNALEVLCPNVSSSADDLQPVVAALTDEALACFAAENATVTPLDEWSAPPVSEITDLPVDNRSRPGNSTWQSVARGRSVETDFLNGEIVLLGRLNGVPTPVNAVVQRLMRSVAAGRVASGSIDPAELLLSI